MNFLPKYNRSHTIVEAFILLHFKFQKKKKNYLPSKINNIFDLLKI